MYVIDIHYTASLERIDDALERHRAYLQPLLDKGIFIAAGPKVPRAGGVILAARIDRDALEAILQTDPFVTEGLATYRVTEFRITRAATGFNVAGAAVTRYGRGAPALPRMYGAHAATRAMSKRREKKKEQKERVTARRGRHAPAGSNARTGTACRPISRSAD